MKHADGAVYEGKMIIVIRAIRQYTDFGMVKNVQYVGTQYVTLIQAQIYVN